MSEKDPQKELPNHIHFGDVVWLKAGERWDIERVIAALGNGGLLRNLPLPVEQKQKMLDFFRNEAAQHPFRKLKP